MTPRPPTRPQPRLDPDPFTVPDPDHDCPLCAYCSDERHPKPLPPANPSLIGPSYDVRGCSVVPWLALAVGIVLLAVWR